MQTMVLFLTLFARRTTPLALLRSLPRVAPRPLNKQRLWAHSGQSNTDTRDVVLRVPAPFKVSAWLASRSAEEVATVLRVGEAVVASEAIHSARAQSDDEREVEAERARLQLRIASLEAERAALRETSKQIDSAALASAAALAERLETGNGALSSKRASELLGGQAELQKSVDELVSKFGAGRGKRGSNGSSMQSIGEAGEELIVSTIARLFPRSSLEPTDKETGRGDALWTGFLDDQGFLTKAEDSRSDPGEFRIMIECKNVATLNSQRDMRKFEQNCMDGFATGRITGAIMLSLRSKTIPRYGRLGFELMGGRWPVLLVADALDQSALFFACQWMLSLHALTREHSLSNDENLREREALTRKLEEASAAFAASDTAASSTSSERDGTNEAAAATASLLEQTMRAQLESKLQELTLQEQNLEGERRVVAASIDELCNVIGVQISQLELQKRQLSGMVVKVEAEVRSLDDALDKANRARASVPWLLPESQ